MPSSFHPHELELIRAVDRGDLEKVKDLFAQYPELKTDLISSGRPWLTEFVKGPSDAVFEFGIAIGLNVNAIGVPPYRDETALEMAVYRDNLERVQRLLEAGANPNLGRPMISCLADKSTPQRQIEYLQRFIQRGAEVNRLYDIYGDASSTFSVLDVATHPEVRMFLISQGALISKEIKRRAALGK